MGCVWYPTGGVEAGIDGFIEFRDPGTGQALNAHVAVQSKATRSDFLAETDSGFDYLCSEKDLSYWLAGNQPVIFVRSRPNTDEAYWVSVKDHFRDAELRKSRRIHFDKQRDRFDAHARDRLLAIAVPSEEGVYFAPPPRKEILHSDLLQVARLPERVYLAQTELRSGPEVRARLNERGLRGCDEWVFRGKRILSVFDLAEAPWSTICDRGTVEAFDAHELPLSDDPEIHDDFVALLNQCLRRMLYPLACGMTATSSITTSWRRGICPLDW